MKKFKFLLAGITALSLSNAVLPLSANTPATEETTTVEETTTTIEETTTVEETTTTVEETEEVTEETLTPEVKGNPFVVPEIIQEIFPDPIVQEAVIVALANNGITNPTKTDIQHITELYLENATSLEGVDQLTMLHGLRIIDSSGVDFSVLENLQFLMEVEIVNSNLTSEDLAFAANQQLLTKLILTTNSITDVSVFAELTQLQQLVLTNNYIQDVTPLAELTSTEIYLNYNHIADVTPLANVSDFVAANQTIFYSSDFPAGPFDYLIWSVGVKHPDVNIIPDAISHGGVYDAAEQGIKFTELSAANTPGYTFGSRAGIAPVLPTDEELDTFGDTVRAETRMSNGQVSRDFSGTVLFVFSETETVPTLPNTGLSDMGTIAGVSSLAGSAVLMAVRKKFRK